MRSFPRGRCLWAGLETALATTAHGQTKEPGKRREDFGTGAMGRAKRLSHGMQSLVGAVDFTKQASGKEKKDITVPFCGIVDPVLLSKKPQ